MVHPRTASSCADIFVDDNENEFTDSVCAWTANGITVFLSSSATIDVDDVLTVAAGAFEWSRDGQSFYNIGEVLSVSLNPTLDPKPRSRNNPSFRL